MNFNIITKSLLELGVEEGDDVTFIASGFSRATNYRVEKGRSLYSYQTGRSVNYELWDSCERFVRGLFIINQDGALESVGPDYFDEKIDLVLDHTYESENGKLWECIWVAEDYGYLRLKVDHFLLQSRVNAFYTDGTPVFPGMESSDKLVLDLGNV